VLESLSVKRLLMHLPWKHADNIDQLFKDPKMTANSVMRRFKKSLDQAHGLATLAENKGISIYEPFSDKIKPSEHFTVLSPSVKFYEELLLAFRCAPEPAVETPFLQKAVVAVKEAVTKWIEEKWDFETLGEPEVNASSAENNSSVVLLFKDGTDQFLFTSDAGVPALSEAVKCAQGLGLEVSTVNGIQVPHHGSKQNVGPAILNVILGPKRKDQQYPKSAFVSVAKGGEPKHPSKKVVNAFMRRGAIVYPTQGKIVCHPSKDAPARPGWVKAVTLPFSTQVEE
jgi:hypothetical protein